MMPSMSSEITKREVKVRDLISPDLLKLLSNNFKQLESSRYKTQYINLYVSENTEVLTSCLEEIIHISNNIQLYMRKRLIPIFIKSNEYKQMINDAQFSSKYPSFSLSNFKREKWSPVKKKANQIFDLIRGSGRNASNILIHGLNSASGAFANSSDLKYNRSSSFDNVSSESILNEDVGSINESFDEIRHSSESLDTNDNHRKSGLFEEVQNRFRTILKEESDTLLPPIADTSTPDLPIENLNPFDETSSEKMNSDVSPVIAVNGEEAVAVDPPFLNSEDFQKNDEAAIMLELENVKKQLVGVSQVNFHVSNVFYIILERNITGFINCKFNEIF